MSRVPPHRVANRQTKNHNLINVPIMKTRGDAPNGSLPKFLLANARSIRKKGT